jgi:hypothetical protein
MATVESGGRGRVRGEHAPFRPSTESMSFGKASAIGACTGLGIVALFVAGIRMAYLPASPPAAANAQAAPEVGPSARASEPLAAARARVGESSDASALPSNLRIAGVPSAAPAPTDASVPSAVAASRPAPVAAPAWHRGAPVIAPGRREGPSAKPATSVAAAEDETAQPSLVPVIPDTPPPAVDPLVKAVQDLEPSTPPQSP